MPLIPTTSRRVYRISRSRRRPTGPVHIPQSPTTRTAWNVTTKHIFSINYQQHCTVIEPLHRFAGPRTRGQVRIPTTHAQIVTHIQGHHRPDRGTTGPPGAPQAYQGHHRPVRSTIGLARAPQVCQGHHRPTRRGTRGLPGAPQACRTTGLPPPRRGCRRYRNQTPTPS